MITAEGRRFRWLPFDGRRHAIDNAIEPNTHGITLCRREIPRVPARWSKVAGCWRTCWRCDNAWRDAEGIPHNPFVERSTSSQACVELAS
ncbi:zinc finger protein [Solihabitans fulvus]|uniref:zinc finger protein n=1 Tax=Solihabitans fulvus TaxID=1892852 RepID=UPI001CB76877|nr:zinc finger protein [Solihabitans fulvus]